MSELRSETLGRLIGIRGVLDRLELLLEGCHEDDSADQLLCSLKSISRKIVIVEAGIREVEAEASEMIEAGVALVERVKLYAKATERGAWFDVDTPAPSDTDTIVLSSTEILSLIQQMPKGASEPPPAVIEAALEAQFIAATIPCPRETLPEFPDDEEDTR